jgi:hypothetical protein
VSTELERKFIHALSNRLAIAYGLLDLVVTSAKETLPMPEAHLERLEKALASLEKMRALMKERRAEIIAEKETK